MNEFAFTIYYKGEDGQEKQVCARSLTIAQTCAFIYYRTFLRMEDKYGNVVYNKVLTDGVNYTLSYTCE